MALVAVAQHSSTFLQCHLRYEILSINPSTLQVDEAVGGINEEEAGIGDEEGISEQGIGDEEGIGDEDGISEQGIGDGGYWLRRGYW